MTDFLLLMKVLKLGLEITSPAQLFTVCDYNPQASRSLKRNNVFIKPSALLCYRNQYFCAKKLALEGSEDTNFKGDSMFCGILVYSRKVYPVLRREGKKFSREIRSALGFCDCDIQVQMAPCAGLGTLMIGICGSEPEFYRCYQHFLKL